MRDELTGALTFLTLAVGAAGGSAGPTYGKSQKPLSQPVPGPSTHAQQIAVA